MAPNSSGVNQSIKDSDQKDNLTFRKLGYALPISLSATAQDYHLKSNSTQTNAPTRSLPDLREGSPQTPILLSGGDSNTPLNSQAIPPQAQIEVHFDWIQGTIRRLTPSDFELFQQILSWSFPQPQKIEAKALTLGPHKFTHLTKNDFGLKYLHYTDQNLTTCLLTISGTALSLLSVPQQITLLSQLTYGIAFKATRLDLTLDDYTRTVEIDQIYNHVKNGKPYSGFKVVETASSFKTNPETEKSTEYKTLYLGGNRKKLRIYDAQPIHEKNANRYELQLRENYATTAQEQLLPATGNQFRGFWNKEFIYQKLWETDQELIDNEEKISQHFANLILGSYDFYSFKDKNLERSIVAPWWRQFKEFINVARYPWQLPKPKPSLQKTANWLYKQVSKSLAIFKHGLDPEFYQEFIDSLINQGTNNVSRNDDFYLIETLLNLSTNDLKSVLKLRSKITTK